MFLSCPRCRRRLISPSTSRPWVPSKSTLSKFSLFFLNATSAWVDGRFVIIALYSGALTGFMILPKFYIYALILLNGDFQHCFSLMLDTGDSMIFLYIYGKAAELW